MNTCPTFSTNIHSISFSTEQMIRRSVDLHPVTICTFKTDNNCGEVVELGIVDLCIFEAALPLFKELACLSAEIQSFDAPCQWVEIEGRRFVVTYSADNSPTTIQGFSVRLPRSLANKLQCRPIFKVGDVYRWVCNDYFEYRLIISNENKYAAVCLKTGSIQTAWYNSLRDLSAFYHYTSGFEKISTVTIVTTSASGKKIITSSG